MSLVLAVQPDPDQAARLSSVCRRIGAELVLAASAPEALAALGGRVPDVVLTAPLLPAADDAAIAERLRTLGEDALHVQALAAPILGQPVVEPQARGLLKAFRRPRPAAGPAVCDPLAFAGELSGHLLRAVAERAAITGEPIVAPPFDEVPTDDGSAAGTAASPRGVPQTVTAPVDIDLTSLLDGIAESPRKRKSPGGRRRKRRVYDDAAYFDPSRCEFAAVLEKFDEFVESGTRGVA